MSEPKTSKFLPIWMWVIVAIEIAVPTFFGIASTLNPAMWGAETLGALGQLYVTRNFAMALGVLIAAVVLRSYAAMFATIAARFVTDFVDIVASFVRGAEPGMVPVLLVFIVLLWVLPVIGLAWLRKQT